MPSIPITVESRLTPGFTFPTGTPASTSASAPKTSTSTSTSAPTTSSTSTSTSSPRPSRTGSNHGGTGGATGGASATHGAATTGPVGPNANSAGGGGSMDTGVFIGLPVVAGVIFLLACLIAYKRWRHKKTKRARAAREAWYGAQVRGGEDAPSEEFLPPYQKYAPEEEWEMQTRGAR